MKDVTGKEVTVGDTVVISLAGWTEFHKGTVVKLSKKQAKVEYGSKKWEFVWRPPEAFSKIEA